MRREKPGGKGKYKTHYVESTVKAHANLERENDPQKTLSKISDCYTSEDSLLDNPARSQTEHKKRKKRMWSPSAERVCEGKVADTVRPPKKQKQKQKQKHQKHHMSSSACAPPAVITIDSDHEKEPQRTECDSNIT